MGTKKISSTKDTKRHEKMSELIFKSEVYAIIGTAIKVHRELGPGFLEPVYQEAFEIEMRERGIPFEAQKTLTISYKGMTLKKEYSNTAVCNGIH